ncbi:hypothetical protein O181_001043 [Austropuccinia psidii MF-1]|uniref:Glutamate 5-kinase n=1 Tax=Austropuccinia psidii MF-1 TaxID=1389203 RepID=A0A9Q3B9Q7_9BASI|nr:hypothetical protein [Austropuccinia psidii MF-1]
MTWAEAVMEDFSPQSPDSPSLTSTIVIKLGTSSIVSEQTLQPKLGLLATLVETCVHLRSIGHKVVLVSSGAIGMGRRRMSLLEDSSNGRWGKKPKENDKQALAAIGQGHLIALWDSLFGRLNQPIAQILLTRGDLVDRSRYLNASSTLTTLLNHGVIPIINENDTLSVAEIKFGDNDTLSAVTAAMCHAEFLFLMTDVDCLYTENPRSNPNAQIVKMVYDIEGVRKIVSTATLGSSLGTGGMATKLIAAELATVAGVSTVICNATKPQAITSIMTDIGTLRSSTASSTHPSAALLGPPQPSPSSLACDTKPLYTVFLPRHTPLTSRKFWVAHGLVPKGSVVINKGAYRAISRKSIGGRLLPAGVVQVCGTFAVAQAVNIMVPQAYLNPELESHDQKNDEPSGSLSAHVAMTNETLGGIVEVGRGLVNYNSSDMDKLKGRQSSEIKLLLGHIESEHVIESIVLFKPSSSSQPSSSPSSLNLESGTDLKPVDC